MKNLKLLAAASFVLPLVACTTVSNYHPQVAAHRGASAYIPEHTLPAKSMAYAMGVDYVEQDVVMSKDGVLFVMHDIYLDTTTDVAQKFPKRARADGRYYVCDFTSDEIRSLRVCERFNPKTGKVVFNGRFPSNFKINYQVPTLEEEFLQVQGLNKSTGRDVSVYVEVKQPDFFAASGLDITKGVVDMMTKYGYNVEGGKAILQTFDYEAMVRSRKELGWKAELCMLVTAGGQSTKGDKPRHAWMQTDEGLKEVAKYASIYAPNFNLLVKPDDKGGYVITDLGARARAAGMKLHSWTHRKDAMPKGFKSWDELLDVTFKNLKIEGMFSDFPDLVVNYLRKNGLHD